MNHPEEPGPVATVRAYLHSPTGRARNSELLLARGLPYKTRLAVMTSDCLGPCTGEELAEIVDEVVLAELETVAA
jgi:hypothetical protein